jgi:hypothetical protein
MDGIEEEVPERPEVKEQETKKMEFAKPFPSFKPTTSTSPFGSTTFPIAEPSPSAANMVVEKETLRVEAESIVDGASRFSATASVPFSETSTIPTPVPSVTVATTSKGKAREKEGGEEDSSDDDFIPTIDLGYDDDE